MRTLTGPRGDDYLFVGRNAVDIYDEFNGGSDTSGDIGDQGWQRGGAGSPTCVAMTPEDEHVGGRRMGTGATSTNSLTAFLASSISTGGILASNLAYFSYLFRLQSITSETFRIGFGNNTLGSATAGIFLKFDPATHANWQTVSVIGAGTETTTTSVVAALDTWYFFECWRETSGVLSFKINDVALVNHTVRLPTTEVFAPQIHLVTNENVAKTFDIDRFRAKSKQFSNRWA